MQTAESATDYHAVLAKQTGLTFAAKLVGFAQAFVVTTVLAKFFGPKVYGEFKISMAVAQTLLPFVLCGLSAGLVKFISQCRAHKNAQGLYTLLVLGAAAGLALACTGSLAFFAARHVIAVHLFHKPHLAQLFAVAAAALLPLVLLRIVHGVYAGYTKPSVSIFHNQITSRVLFIGAAILLFL